MKTGEQPDPSSGRRTAHGRLRHLALITVSPHVRRVRTNLVAILTINALALVTGPIVARALGPSGRGELAAAFLWPELVSLLFSLGLSDAVTYFSSRTDVDSRSVFRTANRIGAIQAVAIWAVGIPVVYFTMRHFGNSAIVSSLIYLAAMPVSLYALYCISLLNGLHRYGWFNTLFVQLFVITAVGYVILFVADDLTVRTAVLANVAAVASTVAVGIVVSRRSLSRRDASHADQPPVPTRRVFTFGLSSWVSFVPHQLNDHIDQLVISVALAPRQLGLYAVAATISTAPGFVGVGVAGAILPTVAATTSTVEQIQIVRRSIRLTFGLTLAAAAVVAALMHPLIDAVFGSAFVPAAASARLLCFAAVMLSVTRVFHNFLKGLGRPIAAAASEGGALCVTAAGLAALLPLFGIIGAAITSLAAYTTSTFIAGGLASSELKIHPLALVMRRDPRSPPASE